MASSRSLPPRTVSDDSAKAQNCSSFVHLQNHGAESDSSKGGLSFLQKNQYVTEVSITECNSAGKKLPTGVYVNAQNQLCAQSSTAERDMGHAARLTPALYSQIPPTRKILRFLATPRRIQQSCTPKPPKRCTDQKT